jgi:hypothetical protein
LKKWRIKSVSSYKYMKKLYKKKNEWNLIIKQQIVPKQLIEETIKDTYLQKNKKLFLLLFLLLLLLDLKYIIIT